jgi:hypothetical protein
MGALRQKTTPLNATCGRCRDGRKTRPRQPEPVRVYQDSSSPASGRSPVAFGADQMAGSKASHDVSPSRPNAARDRVDPASSICHDFFIQKIRLECIL